MSRNSTTNGRSTKRARATSSKRAATGTSGTNATVGKRVTRGERRAGGTRAAAGKRGTAGARSKPNSHEYLLRLYVAGTTPKSLEALSNLRAICEHHLKGRYRLEVVDLLDNPALARGDQILALPALVRQLPPPVKKIIGDFSNAERVLVGLDLRPLARGARATRPPAAGAEP